MIITFSLACTNDFAIAVTLSGRRPTPMPSTLSITQTITSARTPTLSTIMTLTYSLYSHHTFLITGIFIAMFMMTTMPSS